jgi:hypothetical protein
MFPLADCVAAAPRREAAQLRDIVDAQWAADRVAQILAQLLQWTAKKP